MLLTVNLAMRASYVARGSRLLQPPITIQEALVDHRDVDRLDGAGLDAVLQVEAGAVDLLAEEVQVEEEVDEEGAEEVVGAVDAAAAEVAVHQCGLMDSLFTSWDAMTRGGAKGGAKVVVEAHRHPG
eukprot:gene37467-45500_t